MLQILANILLPLSAVIGMLCIAHKRKEGFIVFLISEVSMMYVGYISNNPGFIATAMLYFIMNVYSYCQWSK